MKFINTVFLVFGFYLVGGQCDILKNFKNTPNSSNTLQHDIRENFNENVEKVERVPVPNMIENEGYPVEKHTVTTSDDYVLTLHRIPNGKSYSATGKVVLLQHGLLGASSDWVLLGPKHGLAYKLSEAGYDVWMGNFRGNVYSRQHRTLSSSSFRFWEFSWHEMGTEDLPAIIDYILKSTNSENLYYVGHGLGNTAFYVMASQKPHYNAKIKAQISLAPVGYVGNMFSPILRLIAGGSIKESIFQLFEIREFSPSSELLGKLTDISCSTDEGKVLCKNALFSISGFSPEQINSSSIPLIMAHYPAGASAKQIQHTIQEINSKRFCKFNYGLLNPLHYKSTTPPAYDMSKVTAPVIFMYSQNDWLAAEEDVLRLFKELGNGEKKYRIPRQKWSHLDYIFGNDAPSIIYDKVIEYLEEY